MMTSTVTAPTRTGLLAIPCIPLRFLMGPGGSRGGRGAGGVARRSAPSCCLRRAPGLGAGSAGADGRCRGAGVPPVFAVQLALAGSAAGRQLALADELRRRSAVEVGRRSRAFRDSVTYSRQLVSVTRLRPKWPYWSKPLIAPVAVVDQVDQVVQALGLLGADEELGELRWSGWRRSWARSRAFSRPGRLRGRSGPRLRRRAEALQRHGRGCRERGQVRVASVSDGAALPRSAKTGVAASEKPCRLRIVRRNSRRKRGELLQRGFQFGAAFGARLGRGAGVGEEAGDVGALARERARGSARSRRPAGPAGRAGRRGCRAGGRRRAGPGWRA